jgi:hypothetical protein
MIAKQSRVWKQKMSLSDFRNLLKKDLQKLREAPPGRRFRDFRRYKKEERSKLKSSLKFASIGLAIFLFAFGLAIGWLPGPGGFLALFGLAMLIPYIPGIAPLMDHSEVLVRKCALGLRRIWKR